MADPISALKQELIRINSLGDDAILAALENPEKGLVSLRRALKDVDSFLTGTTQRHPSPYTSEAKAILEGGVVDWHLADGGVSRVAVSSGGKTGSPTLRLDEGLSSPRVIKNWSIAVPERKRPPVRVYEVPKSASTSPAVSHSSLPPPSGGPSGGREFGGVSPQVEDRVRGLPPKPRKKMSVRDHYHLVFGSGSDVDKTKAQMVEELMDFIQETQGDFRGDAAAAQDWSKRNLSADTRNRLLSAWQGVRTERSFISFKAGHARRAGRFDSVDKFERRLSYFDDFAREFSGQPIVSGVRREVHFDIRDILRAMPDSELFKLGVKRFALLAGPVGFAADVLWPSELGASDLQEGDPGYYPEHLDFEEGQEWIEMQDEQRRLMADPVFRGLMPDPSTDPRYAGSRRGISEELAAEQDLLIGGMPRLNQRPVFD